MKETVFDFDALTFTKIEKSYTKVVVFNIALCLLLSFIGIGVFYYFSDQKELFLVAELVGVISFWFLLYRYYTTELKNRKYAIQEEYIVYCSGLFSFTTEIIPFSRIQHTTIDQGWLSKKLGLAKLSFYTAGSHDETIAIRGLKMGTAQTLNAFVLNHLEDKEIENEPLLETENED